MFRLFMLIFTTIFSGMVVSEEQRPVPIVESDLLWFKPQLEENNNPRCNEILSDAIQYYLTDESLEKHYAPQSRTQKQTIAGMRQIQLSPESSESVVLAEKGQYLHSYTHIGCGGGCNKYQLIVTDSSESINKLPLLEASSSQKSSPPLASWFGLYQDPELAHWLYVPDDSQDLLVYKLQNNGQWLRACKVVLNPLNLWASEDPEIKSAYTSLENIKKAVGNLTREAGDCGSLKTHGRWGRQFQRLLPETLYRPWALRENVMFSYRDQFGVYEKDVVGLIDWSLTGTSENDSLRSYRTQLEETIKALASFYKSRYKWGRQLSEEMARTATTSVVSTTIRFYNYEPFENDNERRLRKAILETESLDVIKAIPVDWATLNRDGKESVLALAVKQPDVLQYILSNGLNPNHENAFGKSPLMYAVQMNQLESVMILLKAGANPNARTVWPNDRCYYTLTTSGMTPLHYAVRYASPEIIRLLLDYGSVPYLKSESSITHERTPVKGFEHLMQVANKGAPLEWLERYTGDNAFEKNPNIPDARIGEVAVWLSEQSNDFNALVNNLVIKSEQLYQNKKLAESYGALDLVLALDPKHERALSNMALVALKNNKYGQSLQAAQLLIETSSSDKVIAGAWFNQGLACVSVKDSGAGAHISYNGERYCQYGVLYPFYKSIKVEYSISRRNKLLDVFNKGNGINKWNESYCEIPERGVRISLSYGQDPDVKKYKYGQLQMLYVLHKKGEALSAEDLAWSSKYYNSESKKTEEKRVVPVLLNSVDLGEQILMVLKSDNYIQFPITIFGYQCTGKRQ